MMTIEVLPDNLGGDPLIRAWCRECDVVLEAVDEPPYRAAIERNVTYHNELKHG